MEKLYSQEQVNILVSYALAVGILSQIFFSWLCDKSSKFFKFVGGLYEKSKK